MARKSKISPPSRQRRAINTEAEPEVPLHLQHALGYVKANTAKNLAASDERTEHKKCWQAMKAAKIGSFDFQYGNKTYDAIIASPDKDEVDMDKLFAKYKNGTISEEKFLKCISATMTNVKKALGEDELMAVTASADTEPKLTIKERK